MNPCEWCQDSGQDCVKCGARGLTGADVAAIIVGGAIIVAVWFLLLVAWFGDLQSVPLIGK